MKVINIQQRSELWYEWRKSLVGASESAAILGLSKYKSAIDIWEEKTDRAFPTVINEDMQRGIDNEDAALKLFCEEKKSLFMPMCGEHEKYHYIGASFDGVSLCGTEIVEIKCPRTIKMLNILHDNDLELLKKEYIQYWVQV